MEMTKSQIIAEIESCKKRIEELDKMAQDMKDDELKVWEPKYGELYLYINSDGVISLDRNYITCVDKTRTIFHNAFPKSSKGACEYYSDNVIRVQNMLWQLHELLCPDYFPDWSDKKSKFCVFYMHNKQKWGWGFTVDDDNNSVYFTHEAAIKACEILNRDGVTK